MKLDQSGLWQVCLDAAKSPVLPQCFADVMHLPGTTSCAGLGPESAACHEGHLTDVHAFEGYAWFRREFTVAQRLPLAMLTLERTRVTTVWLDGVCLGTENSLCTPHRYVFPGPEAGTHTLVIRVDNTEYPTRGGAPLPAPGADFRAGRCAALHHPPVGGGPGAGSPVPCTVPCALCA